MFQFSKKNADNIKLSFYLFHSILEKKNELIKMRFFSLSIFPFEEISYDLLKNSKKIKNIKFSTIRKNNSRNFFFSLKIKLNQF